MELELQGTKMEQIIIRFYAYLNNESDDDPEQILSNMRLAPKEYRRALSLMDDLLVIHSFAQSMAGQPYALDQ